MLRRGESGARVGTNDLPIFSFLGPGVSAVTNGVPPALLSFLGFIYCFSKQFLMFPLIRRHVLLLPVLEAQVCRKQKETFLLKNTDVANEGFLIFLPEWLTLQVGPG